MILVGTKIATSKYREHRKLRKLWEDFMQYFQVKVNGTSYDIQVEEISKGPIIQENNGQSAKPASTPQLAVVPSERKDTKRKSGASGEVKAPMPGIIGAIMKGVGEAVEAGESIMLLEAMKLENEVTATKDGVISKICVVEGQGVNAGDLLAEIE